MRTLFVAAVAIFTLAFVSLAAAQRHDAALRGAGPDPSCDALLGGTVNAPDEVRADPTRGLPRGWPKAPAGLLPGHVFLRTGTETFNRLYEFATRRGNVYGRLRSGKGPWRRLPLPSCFAGRVASISADDDEMVALDDEGRIFTMDNALKDSRLFNWSKRWGPPIWQGDGYVLPGGVKAWAWSVISPVEDRNWTDPAGNRTPIGTFKVSHIWGLRSGGRRLTFWDPWLPRDESYEMCGPRRGRFKAINMSASGSVVFVIGPRGDMFTRPYDFDLSGHDPIFFDYSYEDQRGMGDGAPIQLPAEGWTEQPKIPGTITSEISIHKIGRDMIHRILRVEGRRHGRTGFWQRDIAAPRASGWRFHATGAPLQGERLGNPARDTSGLGLGRGEDHRYRMHGDGIRATILDFNVYCSPSRLRIHRNGNVRKLLLHSADGLRQVERGRGLDGEPRDQYGAIEYPDGTFREVTIQATRSQVVVEEPGWRFERVR